MDFHVLSSLVTEFHVLRFMADRRAAEVEEYEKKYSEETFSSRAFATSWHDVEYESRNSARMNLRALATSLRSPLRTVYPEAASMARKVTSLIEEVNPDLIWSCGLASSPAVGLIDERPLWITTLTDWRFRLMKLRVGQKSLRVRLRTEWLSLTSRRADISFLKRADGIVTGSTAQANDMKRFGMKNVHVIPQAYEPFEVDMEVGASDAPRIVHLGGLDTTSNRLGLDAYMDRCHADVIHRLQSRGVEAELVMIGDTSKAGRELQAKLDEMHAIRLGFVADLRTVLRPAEISIIPYEFNTGLRSKLALLFALGQTVVTTSAAVQGMPEVVDGRNARVVDDLDSFPAAIEELVVDKDLRSRIAQGARSTFDEHFRLDGQADRYRAVLESIGLEAAKPSPR